MEKITKISFLNFNICDELYAIETNKVLEVTKVNSIAQIPNSNYLIKGVIDFRGNIVPVFDARLVFNFPPRESELMDIIICEVSFFDETHKISLLVDEVCEVTNIKMKDIKNQYIVSDNLNQNLISGVFLKNEEFVKILDIDSCFSPKLFT